MPTKEEREAQAQAEAIRDAAALTPAEHAGAVAANQAEAEAKHIDEAPEENGKEIDGVMAYGKYLGPDGKTLLYADGTPVKDTKG